MWSTKAAGVTFPSALHSTQSGFASRYRRENLVQRAPYPRSALVPRPPPARLLSLTSPAWASQNLERVSRPHPGLAQGFWELIGISVPRPRRQN